MEKHDKKRDKKRNKQLNRELLNPSCCVCQSRTWRHEASSLAQLHIAKQDGCNICTVIYNGLIALDPSISERQQELYIDWHEKHAYHLRGAPLPLSIGKLSYSDVIPEMRLEFYAHSGIITLLLMPLLSALC
jgi:hypothetical protein